MNVLGLIGSGYSLLCGLALAVVLALPGAGRWAPQGRWAAGALLVALCVVQATYLAVLLGASPLANLNHMAYRIALFSAAPCFWAFARPWLEPAATALPPAQWGLHALPLVLAPVLPDAWVRPLAFGIGALYLARLGYVLWGLRAERAQFAREVGLLALAFALAAGMVVVALVPAVLPDATFATLHATVIGLGLMLVQVATTLRPDLPQVVQEVVQEVAQARYATTTLARVDCEAALERLNRLMMQDRLYADSELALATLAARMEVSAHQLSELLNARIGKSFTRFLREQRVAAARHMLCAEPSASVLSVGLSVGFTSQSSFYDAFREVEGCTPGQYRKVHAGLGGPEGVAKSL